MFLVLNEKFTLFKCESPCSVGFNEINEISRQIIFLKYNYVFSKKGYFFPHLFAAFNFLKHELHHVLLYDEKLYEIRSLFFTSQHPVTQMKIQ